MNNEPRISVVIPTFNRGTLLAATLESIFTQTVPVTEVIVIDDGSTDDTQVVLRALSNEHRSCGDRLAYARQPNQGKSVALNAGIARARGDWIAYDDSDDLWHPEKLEWQLRALAEFPDCGACFTDARFVNNPKAAPTAFTRAGKNYPGRLGRIEDLSHFILHPPHGIFMQTVLVRRDVMALVGDFDPRLRITQDTDFVIRLARQTPLCYVNLPLVDIDRTPSRSLGLMSQVTGKSLRQVEEFGLILEKWQTSLDAADREACRRLRILLDEQANELSSWQLLSGARRDARLTLWRALRRRFTARLALKLLLLSMAPGFAAQTVQRRAGARRASP